MKKLPHFIYDWRKQIALLLYPIDVIDLLRRLLSGVSTSNLSYEKDNDEQKRFEARCYELNQDKVLQEIIQTIIDRQVNFIAKEARDMDLVSFGRGSINGVCLLKEEIERLASLHAERIIRPVEYNKYDVI